MAEVYVVTSGRYSDYHIDGVYDEENGDAASAFAAALDDGRVESFELNENVDALKGGRIPFDVHIYHGHIQRGLTVGSMQAFSSNYPTDVRERRERDGWVNYHLNVVARDREHAAKIAMEKVTQYKALKP